MFETIFNYIFYIFLFIVLYLEVFFLVTFVEEREKLKNKSTHRKLAHYPSVTIIVPCWNEQKTITKTIESLLHLNYPTTKLAIFIVDDGSTDDTWNVVQKYHANPQVTLIKKENGGKHTAVNLGISRATTEIIGCLDADSFVEKNALHEIAHAFNEDPKMMAAIPLIIIHEPKTILQKMQKTEYHSIAFLKRMLSSVDGLSVAPGPFSIFRREVFEKIGYYEKAHNTEDMEIALRMQSRHMRIRNVHTAHVYTSGPETFRKLYRQRLRWMYGGIKNILDYRFMIFRRKYGFLGMITLPLSLLSIVIFLYNFSFVAVYAAQIIFHKIIEVDTVGFWSGLPSFDPFFFNTNFAVILSYIFLGLVLVIIWNGTKLAEGRFRPTFGIFYFLILYGIIAPIWILRAIGNVLFSRETTWR